jgi:hypothetical protein
MYPTVTHVVVIFELTTNTTEFAHDCRDRNAALVLIALRSAIEFDLFNPPIGADTAFADAKFMRMRILPAHHPLQIAMQRPERSLIGNNDPPPDKWCNLLQFDT